MENDDTRYLVNVTHEFKAPISNLKLIIETLYEYNETISSYKRKETRWVDAMMLYRTLLFIDDNIRLSSTKLMFPILDAGLSALHPVFFNVLGLS